MDNWGYLFFNESMMGFWHALLWIVVMAIVIGITILSTRKYFERIARQRQPQKTLDELEENYRAISRQEEVIERQEQTIQDLRAKLRAARFLAGQFDAITDEAPDYNLLLERNARKQ